MTRALLAVAVTAALVGGWLSAPVPVQVEDDPGLEPAAAAAVVCPLRVDRTVDGSVAIGSTLVAPSRITVGDVGSVVTDVTVEVDRSGGATVPFTDLIAGGVSGAFIELGVPAAASAAVSRSDAGLTAVSCPSLLRTTSVITGASTRNGESLELVLVNPYGSDAVVAVESSSEIGADSADELAAVVVPARSTVTRDLSSLLPLRNRLSLVISPARGLVHAFVEGGGRGGRVVIEHTTPGAEWIAPVPDVEGQSATLVVSTVSPIEVAVRVDAWADGELVEGVFVETLPARGQVEIPLQDLDPAVEIVHVRADGPIGATIVLEGGSGRAASPANPLAFQEWLMPGPGAAGSTAWIAVPGDEDAVVELQSLTAGEPTFTVDIGAGRLVSVPLDDDGVGYILRADVPVTVLWSVIDESGLGLAAPSGLPGGE